MYVNSNQALEPFKILPIANSYLYLHIFFYMYKQASIAFIFPKHFVNSLKLLTGFARKSMYILCI